MTIHERLPRSLSSMPLCRRRHLAATQSATSHYDFHLVSFSLFGRTPVGSPLTRDCARFYRTRASEHDTQRLYVCAPRRLHAHSRRSSQHICLTYSHTSPNVCRVCAAAAPDGPTKSRHPAAHNYVSIRPSAQFAISNLHTRVYREHTHTHTRPHKQATHKYKSSIGCVCHTGRVGLRNSAAARFY